MFTREQLKTNAKQQLKGNWGMGVLATLIVMAIAGAASGLSTAIAMVQAVTKSVISGGAMPSEMLPLAYMTSPFYYIGMILTILISAVFFFGMPKFYLGLSRTRSTALGDLFGAFKMFGKVIGAYLLISLYTFLWSLLFIVPGIVASYRYRMVPYLLVDNPDIGICEAIRRSKEMMRGHKGELFVLDLSFLGWGLLCGLTFGIGLLWLDPYMETTFANYYDALNSVSE